MTVALLATDEAIGGVVGSLLTKRAFDRRRQRQLIAETPTEEIESLSIGPSEVNGRAVPAEGAIPAPFSDDECLVAQWRVEEYYEDDDSSGWRTRSSGVECTPFYVDDGTGQVLFVPDDVVYDIETDTEPVFEVRAFQRPPDAVTEFFDRRGRAWFDPLESPRSTLDLGRQFDFRRGGGFTFSTGSR